MTEIKTAEEKNVPIGDIRGWKKNPKTMEVGLVLPKCEFKNNGLILAESLTFDNWQKAGKLLSQIEAATQWWIGDWCNFGERKYGEMYSQALEITDYAYQTIRDAAWVAGQIELSRRRDNLSWSHHREVSSLESKIQDYWLDRAEKENLTRKELRKLIREEKIEKPKLTGEAIIYKKDALEFLAGLKEKADLLLTDPPYMTDIKEDVRDFADRWVPAALARLKPTGRAYIFTGAYPRELFAYLSVLIKQKEFIFDTVLVWTYENTLGPAPAMTYKLNWQACFYLYGKKAAKLECPVMMEQFSVQKINAPDARTGVRYGTWEKPEELAERFVRHSSKEDDLVIDPFAGTGTFLLAAAKFKRRARGCDNSEEMLKIAEKRGCRWIRK